MTPARRTIIQADINLAADRLADFESARRDNLAALIIVGAGMATPIIVALIVLFISSS